MFVSLFFFFFFFLLQFLQLLWATSCIYNSSDVVEKKNS